MLADCERQLHSTTHKYAGKSGAQQVIFKLPSQRINIRRLYIKLYVYTRQPTVSLAATRQRRVSCNQSETRMLASDWSQLTGLIWFAAIS